MHRVQRRVARAGGPKFGRAVLTLGAAGLAMVAAAPAWSQEAAPEAGSDPNDEIVVTAQKREERLLDVPVPVTAVSSDTLVKQNLLEIRDYFTRIPSLQYSGDRVQNLSLRGITTGGATNPTLAILVDDVPFGSATQNGASNIPNFDPAILERIEVLRGPQGTLYGAASLGGLIKYVTRQPSTTDFSGQFEIGAVSVAHGGFGHSMRGSVNVPILEDRVGLAVSGFYRRNPAWVDNIESTTGFRTEDANRSRDWGGRAALLLRPFDNLTISVAAMKQESRSSGSGAVDFVSVSDFRGVPEDLAVVRTAGQPSFSKFELYSARADLDLGFATLSSVSGWNVAVTTPLQDLTAIFGGLLRRFYPGLATVNLVNAHRTTRFSQEVRLAGMSKVVDWLVGGFYSIEHANISQTMQLLDASGGELGVPYDSSGPSAYREYAAFGDLTFHVTDRFDMQVGARYGRNRMNNFQNVTTEPTSVPIFGPSTSEQIRRKDKAFTWLAAPSFKVTPDVMIYARVANGYRPGGTNALLSTIPLTYENDSVINYELGTKGTLLDRRIEFDVSLFQIDWKDIQLQGTSSANNFTFTTNGGKARSRGVEVQTSLRPWKDGTLSVNGSYIDAVLTEDLPVIAGATGLVGAAGDSLPYTAKFSSTVDFQQNFELSDGLDLSVGATYSYLGPRWSEFVNSDPAATGVRMRLPSYSQVDLRTGLALREGWRLDAFVRNLFDKRGVVIGGDRGGTVVPTGSYIRPRSIGFTVSGSF
jgi:outer membrane receptor protein involved in Fe transport